MSLSNIHPKTGEKILFDYSDWQKTGIAIVDLVAQVVGYHRKQLIPIKAIYLKKNKYDEFFNWVLINCRAQYGKKEAEDMLYGLLAIGRAIEFDSVDIRELNAEAEATMKYTIGKYHTKDGSYMERCGNVGWIEIYPQIVLPENKN